MAAVAGRGVDDTMAPGVYCPHCGIHISAWELKRNVLPRFTTPLSQDVLQKELKRLGSCVHGVVPESFFKHGVGINHHAWYAPHFVRIRRKPRSPSPVFFRRNPDRKISRSTSQSERGGERKGLQSSGGEKEDKSAAAKPDPEKNISNNTLKNQQAVDAGGADESVSSSDSGQGVMGWLGFGESAEDRKKRKQKEKKEKTSSRKVVIATSTTTGDGGENDFFGFGLGGNAATSQSQSQAGPQKEKKEKEKKNNKSPPSDDEGEGGGESYWSYLWGTSDLEPEEKKKNHKSKGEEVKITPRTESHQATGGQATISAPAAMDFFGVGDSGTEVKITGTKEDHVASSHAPAATRSQPGSVPPSGGGDDFFITPASVVKPSKAHATRGGQNHRSHTSPSRKHKKKKKESDTSHEHKKKKKKDESKRQKGPVKVTAVF